mgnify:CR=1 FL=1
MRYTYLVTEKIQQLTKKQHSVYEKIKHYITTAGVSPTLEELRQMLGFNNLNSVSQYLDALEQHGLIKRRVHQKRSIELVTPDLGAEQGMVVLPVIASAGCDAVSVYAERQFDEYLTIDKSYIPARHEPENFVIFKAVGDSMNAADIENGDYALVERTDDVRSGDRVVATLGDMSVIKRLRHTANATFFEPDSRDPRYKRIVAKDDARIFGKVIAIIKRQEREEVFAEYPDGRREYIT